LIRTDFRRSHRSSIPTSAGIRRIEQEGVFPNQSPGCPVEFNQHIDEGLVDGPVATDFYDSPTPPSLDRHAQSVYRRSVVNPRLPESICGREARSHVLELFRRRGYFHLGAQGLTETAQNGNAPQTGGMSTERECADSCCEQGAFEPTIHEVLMHEG
jgi:hypothetical protein